MLSLPFSTDMLKYSHLCRLTKCCLRASRQMEFESQKSGCGRSALSSVFSSYCYNISVQLYSVAGRRTMIPTIYTAVICWAVFFSLVGALLITSRSSSLLRNRSDCSGSCNFKSSRNPFKPDHTPVLHQLSLRDNNRGLLQASHWQDIDYASGPAEIGPSNLESYISASEADWRVLRFRRL